MSSSIMFFRDIVQPYAECHVHVYTRISALSITASAVDTEYLITSVYQVFIQLNHVSSIFMS
jgi:hypothetical protein